MTKFQLSIASFNDGDATSESLALFGESLPCNTEERPWSAFFSRIRRSAGSQGRLLTSESRQPSSLLGSSPTTSSCHCAPDFRVRVFPHVCSRSEYYHFISPLIFAGSAGRRDDNTKHSHCDLRFSLLLAWRERRSCIFIRIIRRPWWKSL